MAGKGWMPQLKSNYDEEIQALSERIFYILPLVSVPVVCLSLSRSLSLLPLAF